jgi:hypothetical protein
MRVARRHSAVIGIYEMRPKSGAAAYTRARRRTYMIYRPTATPSSDERYSVFLVRHVDMSVLRAQGLEIDFLPWVLVPADDDTRRVAID